MLVFVEGACDSFNYPEEFSQDVLFFRILVADALIFLLLYYFLICIDSLMEKFEADQLPTCNPLLMQQNQNYRTNE